MSSERRPSILSQLQQEQTPFRLTPENKTIRIGGNDLIALLASPSNGSHDTIFHLLYHTRTERNPEEDAKPNDTVGSLFIDRGELTRAVDRLEQLRQRIRDETRQLRQLRKSVEANIITEADFEDAEVRLNKLRKRDGKLCLIDDYEKKIEISVSDQVLDLINQFLQRSNYEQLKFKTEQEVKVTRERLSCTLIYDDYDKTYTLFAGNKFGKLGVLGPSLVRFMLETGDAKDRYLASITEASIDEQGGLHEVKVYDLWLKEDKIEELRSKFGFKDVPKTAIEAGTETPFPTSIVEQFLNDRKQAAKQRLENLHFANDFVKWLMRLTAIGYLGLRFTGAIDRIVPNELLGFLLSGLAGEFAIVFSKEWAAQTYEKVSTQQVHDGKIT